MRRVIYGGAMSLDGYIAGPNGEYDWIVMDPEIDFAARLKDQAPPTPAIRQIVFSRTLRPGAFPDVTIEPAAEPVVARLREEVGKEIAVFGGGELFRSLLAAGLVDAVEVSVIPVLLGGGIPFLPPPSERAALTLRKHRVYAKTGTIGLEYDIRPPARKK